MKQVAITGERQAELVDKAMPELRDGWALVKIIASPMCAEYKAFQNGHRSDCLGHEAAGEVVQVAPGSNLEVGDRVVVMPQYSCGQCALCLSGEFIYCENGLNYDGGATMAQYIAKPSWMLPKIPDGVPFELASLACCGLGPSHGAFEKMDVGPFTTVLIAGLGPVGLGAVLNAKYRGAKVIAIEMNEFRINLARELGADVIIDPRDPEALSLIKAATNGIGPDCALDCSGVVSAHRLLIDSVRRLGKVAFVGECSNETPIIVSDDLLRKGIQLIGSWHYNLNEFPKLMQIIQQSEHIGKLITHTYPMSSIQEAFETSAGQTSAKIILKPWD